MIAGTGHTEPQRDQPHARPHVTSSPPHLTRDQVREVVRAATLAPSILNVQPWRFVARDGSVELFRDAERVLPAADPIGRALTISCGAALLNLRLAVAALGRRPQVEVLPEGPRSMLIARVSAGEQVLADETERRLHAAIPQRRSSRVPFLAQPIPPEVVVELEGAAAAERATFQVLDADVAVDVGELVRAADRAQMADHELRAEVLSWVGRGKDAVDGVPWNALGPTPIDPTALVRDLAMGEPVRGRSEASFERWTTLGVVSTTDDEPRSWIEAGQAIERVWLEAPAAGLAVSLLGQPLEVSLLRWFARPLTGSASGSADVRAGPFDDVLAPASWPQALLRIGVALGRTPPTPRRPRAEVLSFA